MTTTEIPSDDLVAQTLRSYHLPVKPCGLNADWSVSAWHLSSGATNHYLLDTEHPNDAGQWLYEIVSRRYATNDDDDLTVIVEANTLAQVLSIYSTRRSLSPLSQELAASIKRDLKGILSYIEGRERGDLAAEEEAFRFAARSGRITCFSHLHEYMDASALGNITATYNAMDLIPRDQLTAAYQPRIAQGDMTGSEAWVQSRLDVVTAGYDEVDQWIRAGALML